MNINMGLPEIIYLMLVAMSLGITIIEHGTLKDRINNFLVALIAQAFTIALLVWGGFFTI